MGVQRKVVKNGNGVDYPKKGDNVTMEYTGNLYDKSAGEAKDYRGDQYVQDIVKQSFKIRLIRVIKVRQLCWSRCFHNGYRGRKGH